MVFKQKQKYCCHTNKRVFYIPAFKFCNPTPVVYTSRSLEDGLYGSKHAVNWTIKKFRGAVTPLFPFKELCCERDCHSVVDKTWDLRGAFVKQYLTVSKLMDRIWIAYVPPKLVLLETVCWVNTSIFKILEPECTSMILETEYLVYSRHF
jgi:hypothetical protein